MQRTRETGGSELQLNDAMNSRPPLLSAEGICIAFDGTPVLDNVSLRLQQGEVHALCGENGAGKSTLIKILGGVYQDYRGTVRIDGKSVRFASVQHATACGISVIHQELSLIPSLSVSDNIFLGRENVLGKLWVNGKSQAEKASELLGFLGLQIDVHRAVEEFPMAVQQMVEIAKALNRDARVLIMDEPTSSLNRTDCERLFQVVDTLKRRGCGVVFVSHRMDEIYRISDRITVLRDGGWIGASSAADLPRDTLIQWMVGRELAQQFPPRSTLRGNERLRLRDFSVPDPAGDRRLRVDQVSLTARAGEILGIAGLEGSGKSDLLLALFGARGRRVSGEVRINGIPVQIGSPRQALRHGLALLTNDRKASGLVMDFSVAQNMTLASLQDLSPWGWLRTGRERELVRSQMVGMRVKAASDLQPVRELSGGNQQKVLLGRWILTDPQVLLLDEPTRGVDVGAKHEIYELMNRWTESGKTILFISSEMEELLAMSDRVIVLHRGQLAGEFEGSEISQEAVLTAAMGGMRKAG
ncbi:MAG: sugar ABC transporter ATP-binding protein [Acidobacteriota bacterium]